MNEPMALMLRTLALLGGRAVPITTLPRPRRGFISYTLMTLRWRA